LSNQRTAPKISEGAKGDTNEDEDRDRGAAIALALGGCYLPPDGGKPIPNGTSTSSYYGGNTYSPTTTTEAALPQPSDFTLNVIELSRDCFGSAGCNITYRINPVHTGSGSLDGQSFTLIYQVEGGDNPKTGNIKVVNGKFNTEQDFISTSSSSAQITATVTQIVPD
jgi:hypothetical protein